MTTAEIGVFGGSGFYSFLEDAEEVEVDTPYGKLLAPITIGEVGGKRVAFLPRHGRSHERLRELLFSVIPKIPPQPELHLCATALRGRPFLRPARDAM
jgi:purine nucleoside phosphorylase